VNDAPDAGLQALFRRQQNLPSERVDYVVALDTAKFCVSKPLLSEAGDEDLVSVSGVASEVRSDDVVGPIEQS